MHVAQKKNPNALFHFEDISIDHGLNIIYRYRDDYLVFNDCISGTASTILAGILSGLKIQKRKKHDITKLKFVIVGAGNAGMGIVTYLHNFLTKYGLSAENANDNIYILDVNGLITYSRENMRSNVRPYARKETDLEGISLEDLVKKIKPNVLIGVSGKRGIFTEKVLSHMPREKNNSPMIFALSNPTSKAECDAKEAQKFTKNTAIFASGSPFDDVSIGGKTIVSNQAHNAYIFPGLALGANIGKLRTINDSILLAASEALTDLLPANAAKNRSIYPDLNNIRDVAVHVAYAVIKKANQLNMINNEKLMPLLYSEPEDLKDFIRDFQWQPEYRSLIFTGN